jgi:hypothetical protein
MLIVLDVISGFMVGVELLWEDKTLVVDCGILRIFFTITDKEE